MMYRAMIGGKAFEEYFASKYSDISDKNNKLNLYIHIPFCTRICSYCNCFKKLMSQKGEVDRYIEYLKREAEIIYQIQGKKKIPIHTIFIGGGTPNILTKSQFEKLYFIITQYFDLSHLEQFLIDGHPNYYTPEKIDSLQSIGVRRLTFAVQTFDEEVLKINNRDTYDREKLKQNLEYVKQKGIDSNIDILIGLKGQTFESIKNDIAILKTLEVANVSVHYFMNSNNIDYEMDENYLDLIEQTKEYLDNIELPHNASNVQEDYFVSKRNSTLSLGATAVTNIFGQAIFQKPENELYYKALDEGELPVQMGLEMTKRDEMVKYVYLNILFGVNRKDFFSLYGEDIFRCFSGELQFLINNSIISLQNDYIMPKTTDYKVLLYMNIFFVKKFVLFDRIYYNQNDFGLFFGKNGDLIDK